MIDIGSLAYGYILGIITFGLVLLFVSRPRAGGAASPSPPDSVTRSAYPDGGSGESSGDVLRKVVWLPWHVLRDDNSSGDD